MAIFFLLFFLDVYLYMSFFCCIFVHYLYPELNGVQMFDFFL